MTTHLVYITASSKSEALSIARTLVAEKLVACSNVIGGVESFYWWDDMLEEAEEIIVIAKTTEERLEAVTQRVKELHSAACPCVVAVPVAGGNREFLEWVGKSTDK
jgi:periplasmic divalent cation tolerance protein